VNASTATGLQEGCTATMTAPRTAQYHRPEQGGWWSWRPDSNRDRLFTRQQRIVHGVLASALLAAQVGWVISRFPTAHGYAGCHPPSDQLDRQERRPGMAPAVRPIR
jgi:hypothetical protein